MADQGHAAETPSFDQASRQLAEAATAIGQGLSQLQTALGGHENALSRDEIGGPFTQEYLPLLNRAFTAIASYQEQVRYASDGLATSADVLRHLEELNDATLAQLRQPWKGEP
jgi:hypothetical protein